MQHDEKKVGGRELLITILMSYAFLTLLAATISEIPLIKESPNNKILQNTVGIISFQCTFLCSSIISVFYLRMPSSSALGITQGSWIKVISWTISTALVAILLCYSSNALLHNLLVDNEIAPTQQEAVKDIQKTQSDSVLFLLFFTTVLLAPVSEELFFRCVLFHTIKKNSQWFAYVFISLIFAVLHMQAPQSEGMKGIIGAAMTTIPFVLLSSLLFTVYRITKNILAPIGCHILFNLTGFLIARGYFLI